MGLRRVAVEILGTVILGLVAGSIFASLLFGSECLAVFVGHLIELIRYGVL